MAILTASDKEIFFPSVSLSGLELEQAIANVQALIEAEIGRKLERGQVRERKKLHSVAAGIGKLGSTPIDLSQSVIIHGQWGGGRDRYGTVYAPSEWEVLTGYQLTEDGHLQLQVGHGIDVVSHIQAVYTGGIDFSLDTIETRSLKMALGNALSHTQLAQFQGIAERESYHEYRVKYSGSDGSGQTQAGQLPLSILKPFLKYKINSTLFS